MKKIKLSDGQYAFCDDEDFEKLNKYEWHPVYINGKCHAGRFVTVKGVEYMRLMEYDVIEGTQAFRFDRN